MKVPKSTIMDRVSGKSDQVGHPCELTKEEEEVFVERLLLLSQWGFPITSADMCHLIKA